MAGMYMFILACKQCSQAMLCHIKVTVNMSFTFLNGEYADMHFMLSYAVVTQMLPLRSITSCFHNKKIPD
jgi:hypothetical protein